MMAADDISGQGEKFILDFPGGSEQKGLTVIHMPFHFRMFHFVQPPPFEEYGIADSRLADVMERTEMDEEFPVFGGKDIGVYPRTVELPGQRPDIMLHPDGMAAGVGVPDLDGRRQPLQYPLLEGIAPLQPVRMPPALPDLVETGEKQIRQGDREQRQGRRDIPAFDQTAGPCWRSA